MGKISDWLKFQKEHREVKKMLTGELNRSYDVYEKHLMSHGYSKQTAKKESSQLRKHLKAVSKKNRRKR